MDWRAVWISSGAAAAMLVFGMMMIDHRLDALEGRRQLMALQVLELVKENIILKCRVDPGLCGDN